MKGAWAGIMLIVLGCAQEDQLLSLPPIAWEGEHVHVGASDDVDELCGGTLPYTDAYFGALKERLGVPASDVAEVYWLPDGIEAYDACHVPEYANACAHDGDAFAETLPNEHELVHAANFRSGGYTHPLFEEGSAMYWGDDTRWLFDELDVRDALADVDAHDGQYLAPEYYGTAATWLAYLVDTYGEADSFALLDAVTRPADLDDVETSFGSVLGETLDAVIGDYDANYPRCETLHARDATISCTLAEPATCRDTPSDGPASPDVRLVIEADLSCESKAVLGPKRGERWRSYTFEVRTPETYNVFASPLPEGPPDFSEWGSIILERCDAGCERFAAAVSMEGGSAFMLEPGTYRIRLARAENAPAETVTGFRVEVYSFNWGTDLLCPQ